MNIKLKATLITLAVFLGPTTFCYTIVNFPLVILFASLGVLLYLVYRGVLNHFEHKERFKK
jgi:uncharacterized membrane protein YesL